MKKYIYTAILFLFLGATTSIAAALPNVTPLENRTPESIALYKTDVLAIHDWATLEGFNIAETIVTFSSPIPIQQIQAFADRFQIDIFSIHLYTIDAEGDLAVGIGSLDATSEIIGDLRSDSQEILGVYVLNGSVSIEKLKELQKNENIFLVDIRADSRITGNGQSFGEEMLQ